MLLPNQPDYSSSETPLADTERDMCLTYSGIGKKPKGMKCPPDKIRLNPHTNMNGLEGAEEDQGLNWPRTRLASITISGVKPIGDANNPLVTGIEAIAPGNSIDYYWEIVLSEEQTKRKQTHLFFSHGAPAGGEGDGGSLVHGLFGALNIEPVGSRWYRSQVDEYSYKTAREQSVSDSYINYNAVFPNSNVPVLKMLKLLDDNRYELIYGDLNAIIQEQHVELGTNEAFREFTVIFHDELKTFYADQFKEVGTEFTLSGVGDGFAINYGASGMATILLANRKAIGPSKNCVNCAYEEFFLESWVNGDPALLTSYADDPSNVHHSYLNDRVEFRNLHAGPKETHVFHLHAHQWLSQESDTGTYLDSQTIGPQQGFTYPMNS